VVKRGDNLYPEPSPSPAPFVGDIAPAEAVPAEATPSERRADLVLEGGGVKGIGLIGAISVLEQAGYSFPRVAGTSAGAIVGALVAAGMSSEQLKTTMSALDYTKFRDDTKLDAVPLLGKALSLWLERGIYAGNYFHGWIREQLDGLGIHTFRDLRQDDPGSSLPSDQRYGLVVMTSDVTRGQLLRLPWDYDGLGLDADDEPIADAVRASMSIPFFYRPIVMPIPHASPSVLVDGGMLSNFPVDTFDRTDGKPPRWPTIGIKLSARQKPNVVEHRVNGDLSLALAMLGTMQSWSDQMHLDDPAVIKRTIFVDTMGVNATDFEIDQATQAQLFDNGVKAAEAFLQSQ
jgi:NTE family protein